MKPSFIAMHTENVNSNFDSVCHVLLLPVVNGEPQEIIEMFADPQAPFEEVSSGIKENEIKDFKPFEKEWPGIAGRLAFTPIVISTAEGSAVRSLHKTLKRLGIAFMEKEYGNAKAICRRGLKEVSYNLDYLGSKILNRTAYDDEPDEILRLWVDLVLKALENAEETTVKEFMENHMITVGRFGGDELTPSLCKSKSSGKSNSPYTAEYYRQTKEKFAALMNEDLEAGFDPESPLFGMTVVFTGQMNSMSRNDAREAVIRIGGSAPESMKKSVNYLVVGNQDMRIVGPEGMSSKMRKAAEWNAKGAEIEIITEKDFLELLNYK